MKPSTTPWLRISLVSSPGWRVGSELAPYFIWGVGNKDSFLLRSLLTLIVMF
jgi:hypothetical protein